MNVENIVNEKTENKDLMNRKDPDMVHIEIAIKVAPMNENPCQKLDHRKESTSHTSLK